MVPDGLEIATYQKQIDVVMMRFLQYSDVTVDGIQLAMTAAFDSDLTWVGHEYNHGPWKTISKLTFIFRDCSGSRSMALAFLVLVAKYFWNDVDLMDCMLVGECLRSTAGNKVCTRRKGRERPGIQTPKYCQNWAKMIGYVLCNRGISAPNRDARYLQAFASGCCAEETSLSKCYNPSCVEDVWLLRHFLSTRSNKNVPTCPDKLQQKHEQCAKGPRFTEFLGAYVSRLKTPSHLPRWDSRWRFRRTFMSGFVSESVFVVYFPFFHAALSNPWGNDISLTNGTITKEKVLERLYHNSEFNDVILCRTLEGVF